jgi:hypothetical protein
MMEAVCNSETSVYFHETAWRYIPEGYLSSSIIYLLLLLLLFVDTFITRLYALAPI